MLQQIDTAHLAALEAELARVTKQRDALRDAVTNAEFLLRKVGINWKEAGSMADSMLRSADDARNALQACQD